MKILYRTITLTITLITLITTGTLTMAANLPGPLADTGWLKTNLGKTTILDVRKDTKSFTAKPVFRKNKKTGKLKLVKVAGHIPGANLVNYKKLRTKQIINEREISKMLLNKGAFEKLMQSVGVNKGDTIIIVSKGESNGDMTGATRLYWSLKYFGHDKISILNGGMAQWLKDGGKISSAASKVKKGNWVATAERKEILATSKDVKKAIKNPKVQLIDTRPISQYIGAWKKSYVYAKGHIPGAKNLPNELLTGPKGKIKFTSAKEMKDISRALGIDSKGSMITYCNSGHLATGSWFMYSEVLGNKNVKMYDGSMHQWTKEKGNTVTFKIE